MITLFTLILTHEKISHFIDRSLLKRLVEFHLNTSIFIDFWKVLKIHSVQVQKILLFKSQHFSISCQSQVCHNNNKQWIVVFLNTTIHKSTNRSAAVCSLIANRYLHNSLFGFAFVSDELSLNPGNNRWNGRIWIDISNGIGLINFWNEKMGLSLRPSIRLLSVVGRRSIDVHVLNFLVLFCCFIFVLFTSDPEQTSVESSFL